MKLLVGLGNPGREYEKTWHNLGFEVAQLFGKQVGVTDFKLKKKLKALVADATINEEKIILTLPQTFMNKSGESVRQLISFYKITLTDLWVIHDEIDLEVGSIKISTNVSGAGHRGVQSIIDAVGGQTFTRFRIGIRSERQGQIPTEDFVLQKYDRKTIEPIIKKTAAAIQTALTDGLAKAQNQFH
ncbi:MAG: aminoacyl-tRNA hydrolase [Candidatus Buchananbacteria bacterium RIFCSPHIGHO2_01_FULL_47_11b]|uniref:Peptidyl-tRNA hydrolase n=1 Tax=Candidatus Buchananbacteria bacterium RIFCSPHIGHO2_01_FULL_47_11b TaxID=1797537 RepID=A0A1G1Y7I9_9BACT|nr:MAG: aminoacyl-tRNA hydrolase [Candidatus Buchananbacteria bacterium RIFCSPHIGHO2_01_FULL_47_11b]